LLRLVRGRKLAGYSASHNQNIPRHGVFVDVTKSQSRYSIQDQKERLLVGFHRDKLLGLARTNPVERCSLNDYEPDLLAVLAISFQTASCVFLFPIINPCSDW
jgi:hypothetical protein